MTAAHISPPVISSTSSLLLAPASSASSAPIPRASSRPFVARVYRNDPTVRDGFQDSDRETSDASGTDHQDWLASIQRAVRRP